MPHKVDQLGNFESFHLPHFFQPNFEAYREKRDFNHPESVRYNLFFDGKDHVIELLPNYGLTSPEFVREYHYKDSGKSLKARRFEMEHPVMCHYTGSVKDIEGSRVALSTCDGLVRCKLYDFWPVYFHLTAGWICINVFRRLFYWTCCWTWSEWWRPFASHHSQGSRYIK